MASLFLRYCSIFVCSTALVIVAGTPALAAPKPVVAAPVANNISNIVVHGNQRIETGTVENYLGLKRGDTPTQYDLDGALKKLYDTGFFSDVTVHLDNHILEVDVVENPSVNEVIFEGNDALEKSDLDKELTLTTRSTYTRTKVQTDLKRLLDVYRRNGRYSAQITPQIIQLPQNRVNLVYNIIEGPKAFIEKITFLGNHAFNSSDLEQVINSTREHWYQFLSDSDKYDPDRMQYDQELLRRFYFENGYADFKVKSAIAELSPKRDAFYITFTVEEGEQYHFGTIDIKNTLPSGKIPDLQSVIRTKTGDLYNATEVENTIDKMVDKLGDAGFAFVQIDPDTVHREGKDRIIDLTYNIHEGPKVYVERINIFGNMSTLDDVIRREFRLSEGDAYSTTKIKATEKRLNNLGYFEKVDIQNKPGTSPDQTQIDVQVKEKSTGDITVGAGFSSSDGPLADFGITERNFLGTGKEVHTRILYAANRQNYDVGFTEPYFLDRQLEAGVDLYKTTEDYSDEAEYNRDAIGATAHLTYALSEQLKHQLRYNIEENRITNVADDASIYIKEQEGKNTTSMVGHSLIYDARDNRFSPTEGLYLRGNQDIAGLGGTDHFIRHEVQGQYYIPLAKKWTLETTGAAGNVTGIGEGVRINQRFIIGSDQIRGFNRAGIGPRDVSTGDALGGNNYYTASEELHFPLGLPDDLGISGGIFVDAGSEWGINESGPDLRDSSSMRAAAGFGFTWASQFGPIKIDFAEPFIKESYDKDELVRFSFGTKF